MRKESVLLFRDGNMEVWGSLTEVCRVHKDLKYGTLKDVDLRIGLKYKGVFIQRVLDRSLNGV